MTQKTIKTFINDIYSKPPKRMIAPKNLMFIILMTFEV